MDSRAYQPASAWHIAAASILLHALPNCPTMGQCNRQAPGRSLHVLSRKSGPDSSIGLGQLEVIGQQAGWQVANSLLSV